MPVLVILLPFSLYTLICQPFAPTCLGQGDHVLAAEAGHCVIEIPLHVCVLVALVYIPSHNIHILEVWGPAGLAIIVVPCPYEVVKLITERQKKERAEIGEEQCCSQNDDRSEVKRKPLATEQAIRLLAYSNCCYWVCLAACTEVKTAED